MDDYDVNMLSEAKNEYCVRLVNILTPLIMQGVHSIFDEALVLCESNDEDDKYLMTFQNLISRIPKWNTEIIETERKRICDKSGCNYLDDLVTCVHIIQLKILTAMRVGQKQKKIDINIPKLDEFIHKTYINVARKVYKNVYLFEINIQPLTIQKHYRELEIIVQECILNTLRESIPVESILKAYMDETIEEDVTQEVKEEIIEEPIKKPINNETNNNSNEVTNNGAGLSFNDIDYVKTDDDIVSNVNAPKSIERLEEISQLRNQQRKMEEDEDDDSKLVISDQEFTLDTLDLHNIEEPKLELLPDLIIDDVEILD